jgi:O-antigen/teichoic acid export membrane protein
LSFRRLAGRVGVLAGSAFAGQALVAAALPLLSRLYTPAEFGLATVFASVVGIVTIVASLRYEVPSPCLATTASLRPSWCFRSSWC